MRDGARVVIVASGPSARGFVAPRDVPVIAVNGVVSWINRADYWFSLDASRVNRRWLRLALERDMLCHAAGPHWQAAPRVWWWKRIDSLGSYPEPEPAGSPQWWMWRLGAVPGICKQRGSIHTGNSAWGALGLAWHLGFRDVALVGVDATSEPRIEGGSPDTLCHLPLLFASALPDMRVVSCGQLSGIPQMIFGDWHENR